MKTLDWQRWKKLRLHLSLTLGNDFATEFHSSIHQTLRFNNFKLFWKATNLKCDCTLIKIPSPFRESFANVSNSTLYEQKWKDFWRLYPTFENKKSKNENSFSILAFHSVVIQLRILIWRSNLTFDQVHLCFNHKIHLKIQWMKFDTAEQNDKRKFWSLWI